MLNHGKKLITKDSVTIVVLLILAGVTITYALSNNGLFTKAQVLDILISFAQSIYPEEFNSSKELCPEDFMDAPLCKAQELGLENEFNKAVEVYSNASESFLDNYKPECLYYII